MTTPYERRPKVVVIMPGRNVARTVQAAFDGSAIAPAVFVKGGIGAFAEALAKAATTAGAQIRTGSGVQRIVVTAGKATSVITDGNEEIPAAAIVSGVDPKTTYLQLLDVADLDPDFRLRIGNYRSAGAAAARCSQSGNRACGPVSRRAPRAR